MIFGLIVLGFIIIALVVNYHENAYPFRGVPVPCPYCSNPDRRSVLHDYKGCKWQNPPGVKGGDPECTMDGYFTDQELKYYLGLGS